MSVLWRFGQRGEHIRAKYNKNKSVKGGTRMGNTTRQISVTAERSDHSRNSIWKERLLSGAHGFAKHTDWLPEEVDKAMVMNAVEDTVKHWEGKRVGFCAYHADFTPWNMYVEQDELFVFDWEYAQMTYPPCWINIISSSRHSYSSVTGQPRTSWLMLIRRMGNGWTRYCSNAICWTW